MIINKIEEIFYIDGHLAHFIYLPVKMFRLILFDVYFFSAILSKSHYLMYFLVSAMQPRMLVTYSVDLKPMPVSVRVGQVRKSSKL